MISKLKLIYNQYPPQYWLMIAGIVISTAGGSMIWPFLLIYASKKLDMPLSTVAALISINAGTGLAASFLAGTLADRIGRKAVMVFSLAVNGIAYFFLMRAETYPQFAMLMVLIGLSNPLYQVGADAMLADIIPSAQRTDAYAINRIANNAAFGIGPAIGGFLASTSYNLAFYGASAGFIIYSLLMFFLAKETLGKALSETKNHSSTGQAGTEKERSASSSSGYGRIFKDKDYMIFVAMVGLGLIAPSMLWILMPVYANTNFGVPEALYGWIPTTNAFMCVFIQFSVTRITRNHKTLIVTAMGMLFYAIGAGSVALMTGFWGFWLSMVILTFGELTLVPTASKYVADIAPADLRGRYMSIYWVGWGLSRTIAPLLGGFLNDAISPRSIWIGGLLLGLASTLGLFILHNISKPRETLQTLTEN
ncbi:MAG: MFS transporter [Anaerolineales bacterium]|nr:MFS transporter [Anaerolineales bacterium]